MKPCMPDPLDALLRARDPLDRASLESAPIERALEAVGAAITMRSRPVRPMQRARPGWSGGSRRAGLIAGVAVLSTTAAVAGGAVRSAYTGLLPATKADVAMGGPGEELNPAGSNFRVFALALSADIPYPAGASSARNLVISQVPTVDGGLVSTGAVRGWFARSAFFAWVQAWRAADIAGQSTVAAQAAAMIAAAPRWSAVTAEDPHPQASVPGDLGTTTYTPFGWMLPYRDAVLAGDRARVEKLLAFNYGDAWLGDPAWNAWLAQHGDRLTLSQLAAKYEEFIASGRS